MSDTTRVRFDPDGQTVSVDEGATLLEAARVAGVRIDAPCGGRGVCGACGVRVVEGSLSPPDEMESAGLRRAPSGVRLACRARVQGPVTVAPIAAARAGALPASREAGAKTVGQRLPDLVAAVDLGTSTVAAVLIDRDSRGEVGSATMPNRQSAWGSDVLSRIAAAGSGSGEDLRRAAEQSILEVLEAACEEGGNCLGRIARLLICGNTAMASLLLGLDVSELGVHPFVPPYRDARRLPADSMVAKRLAQAAETIVLPPIASFVGGDVLAGIAALGFSENAPGLLIDLGTNAEVVLVERSGLTAASAAAGPAFEGIGISSGGPAADGAIERVRYDASAGLVLDVIGGGEPTWLCGSGIVSCVALLRRLGHLDADGLFVTPGPLAESFCVRDGVREIALTPAGHIALSQLDVRAFQLAKAAVSTALAAVAEGRDEVLDVDVAVAGGFGSALSPDELVELGVIPRELSARVQVAGNASLRGGAILALDAELLDQLLHADWQVRHVELALGADFTERYLGFLKLEPWALQDRV